MAQPEAGSRDRILGRVRAALRTPAPHHPSADPSAANAPISAPVADPLDRFQKECAANITEYVVTPDLRASSAAVSEILAALPEGEIFVQDAPALRNIAPAWRSSRAIRWSSEGAPGEASQATITLCEALVALTGSVLVSSACGGRGATVVAPVHIVVAGVKQIVPDLDSAFALMRQRGTAIQNSYVCLITGSSRTADIEKILVMGAHGPRRLIVVLAERFE
jgi:L-lactate dehydrogenase complex protein LldG